jgi:hypothetical protein
MRASTRPLVACAVRWVRNADPRVPITAAAVLVDLVEDVNASTGEAHTRVDTIAGRLGITKRAVQRALAALAEHPNAPIKRTFRGYHHTAVAAVTPCLLAYRSTSKRGDTEDVSLLSPLKKTCHPGREEVTDSTRRGDAGVATLKEEPLSVTPFSNPYREELERIGTTDGVLDRVVSRIRLEGRLATAETRGAAR